MKSESTEKNLKKNIPIEDGPEESAPSEETSPANEASAARENQDPAMQEESAAELDPAEIGKLQEAAAKAQENWEKYVRLNADFDNFKKRAARERLEAIKYANESLVERLLPVMDNFEAAIMAAEKSGSDSSGSLATGVKMIASQLRSVLQESGLEEIDAAGQPFDPNWHEALSQQESSEVEEGTVLQQVRKGYKLKDRLLRPASVVVAKAPGSDGGGSAPDSETTDPS